MSDVTFDFYVDEGLTQEGDTLVDERYNDRLTFSRNGTLNIFAEHNEYYDEYRSVDGDIYFTIEGLEKLLAFMRGENI